MFRATDSRWARERISSKASCFFFRSFLGINPKTCRWLLQYLEEQRETITRHTGHFWNTDCATVTHRLTFGPQTSGWGWYIVGCCTWPHIHIAWRVQSYPPRRVGYRKRSHLVCAACRALGCTSTMAYCPPLRSVCVCLHTSRDSCPWQHQLMEREKGQVKPSNDLTPHRGNDAIRGRTTSTSFSCG